MLKYAALLISLILLLLPHPSYADTIYFRFFESIDIVLDDEVYQLLSFTALEGEKVTIVAYGMDSGAMPSISVLDPAGTTIATDTTPLNDHIAYVQFVAETNGIYPIILSRSAPAEGGLIRVMLFEGDPLDEAVSLLDTVDPFLPSRAFLIAAEKDTPEREPIEIVVESRPFEDADDLPLPQFYVSRADDEQAPPLEERLTPVERFRWQNEAGETFYTVNIRPLPEVITPGMQQELVAADAPELLPLEQPLLPYDYVLKIEPGSGEPIRLERPICSATISLAGRTLVVQDVPGEAYRPLATLSGDVTLEIIGIDDTGEWVQIALASSLNGSGWVQNRDFYDPNAVGCQRVIPVAENTGDLNEAITEQISKPIAAAPTPTPIVPTPRPTEIPGNYQLSMSVDNAFPNEGATVRFSISIANFSSSGIGSVLISSGLASGLTFVGVENCPAASGSGCNVGAVPAGESRGYTVVATVNGDTVGQTLTSGASAAVGTQNLGANASLTVVVPPTPVPEAFIAPTAVPPTLAVFDASIAKTINNASPATGANVIYTITVSNLSSVSGSITVNDLLPGEVSYVSHSASQGSYNPSDGNWQVGTLSGSTSATLTITATVTAANAVPVMNTATITSTSPGDANSGNDTAAASFTITGCPALTLNVGAADTAGLITAINLANQCADVNTIELSSTSTYPVTGTDNIQNGANAFPVITAPLIINGNAATIQRTTAPEARFFFIASGVNVTLNSLVLLNANTPADDGGAIWVDGGSLTVSDSYLLNNTTPNFGGGAIYVLSGSLTIDHSTFTNNTAPSGGAVYVQAGTLNIYGSYFGNNNAPANDGGAILTRGTTYIENTTFDTNTAAQFGSAIVITTSPTTIVNSTFINNSAGFTNIDNSFGSTLTLRNSIIVSSNSGSHCSSVSADASNLIFGSGGSCGTAVSGDPLFTIPTGSPLYYPIQSGSAAIGIGTSCPTTDQPGNSRPNTGCDAGTHELP